jgi:hypothetical protein
MKHYTATEFDLASHELTGRVRIVQAESLKGAATVAAWDVGGTCGPSGRVVYMAGGERAWTMAEAPASDAGQAAILQGRMES